MQWKTGRMLAAAVLTLTLTGTAACGHAEPEASGGPTTSVEAGDSKTSCDAVMRARGTALAALAPLSKVLAANNLTPHDIAKAADDLKAALTAMHGTVAAAAENADDPRLKEAIAAYQLSVEQAIVVVEGADGDPAELAAAIDLPELRTAETAVLAACA